MDSKEAHVTYQSDAPSTLFPASEPPPTAHQSANQQLPGCSGRQEGVAGSHRLGSFPSESLAPRRQYLLHHGARHVLIRSRRPSQQRRPSIPRVNIVCTAPTTDNSPWLNAVPSETDGRAILDIRVMRHRYQHGSLGIQFQQQTSSVKEPFVNVDGKISRIHFGFHSTARRIAYGRVAQRTQTNRPRSRSVCCGN